MKFAKELERDLVPEWRLKYLDYKIGKKKLKAITRALRTVNQTPRLRLRSTNTFTPSPFESAPQYSFVNRGHSAQNPSDVHDSGDLRAIAIQRSRSRSQTSNANPIRNHSPQPHEEQPLNGGQDGSQPKMTRYGSILGSPPNFDKLGNKAHGKAPSLKLPVAALELEPSISLGDSGTKVRDRPKSIRLPAPAEDAFKVGKTRSPQKQHHSLSSRYKSVFSPKRVNSTPASPVTEQPRPLFKRVFSMTTKGAPPNDPDLPLQAYRELDIRQAEFFHFLDMELEKVETFYKQKEDEATERMKVLREQLHIMRDCRLDEIITKQTNKIRAKEAKKHAANGGGLLSGHNDDSDDETTNHKAKGHSWFDPLDSALDSALQAVQAGRHGKATKAMTNLASPTGLMPQGRPEDHRDYTRRPEVADVSYQSARRKLKVALQEYYRGLELLKSYSLLNRTAFRKINKKYDKTVNARPTMRYMNEKVNQAWFVQSDVVEGHIRAIEDLYARYFEKGNHKVAVGKLRIKIARAGDFTENSFRNGLFLAAGLVFGGEGVVYGAQLLWSDDERLAVDTSYLLQIYAGYFLMNFLFLLFCLACRVWHESKINYVFVFEYDVRHHLDWRQLSELPCFFMFLLGFFIWLTFHQFGSETMYYYYPVILLAITFLIIICPFRIIYYRSRLWLLYSLVGQS
ncbi:SPX-domain-containing protein [Aaosphaeria arxii CBS 175.79]|uniref:SPX-domain-containing protein n=1 Tax=Aaosphaeria arxii CBS 175.79 TaxID=1450172 RepID=A0A6A5Y7F6_9PLEO|nr:SPX-domain-containing protein [Aaosphaeria arxii CBS 175.79]KAF2021226.1 SPX-domain-containing protein [Aaosphaeria arxii CBS 175.79]